MSLYSTYYQKKMMFLPVNDLFISYLLWSSSGLCRVCALLPAGHDRPGSRLLKPGSWRSFMYHLSGEAFGPSRSTRRAHLPHLRGIQDDVCEWHMLTSNCIFCSTQFWKDERLHLDPLFEVTQNFQCLIFLPECFRRKCLFHYQLWTHIFTEGLCVHPGQ